MLCMSFSIVFTEEESGSIEKLPVWKSYRQKEEKGQKIVQWTELYFYKYGELCKNM